MSILESAIEKYFVEQCEAEGWKVYKVVLLGRRGWPDRYITIGRGHAFYAELKRPKGGILSRAQYLRRQELIAAGFSVYLLHTKAKVDWAINCEKEHIEEIS